MIREFTGIRGHRQAVTLWTAQGESVVVQADAEPGEVAGLAAEWVDCLTAYRLTPQAPGRYDVVFGADALTIHVTPPLPEAEVGFGFYMSPSRFAAPRHEGAYYRLAAQAGANTLAAQACRLRGDTGGAPQWIARQLNRAGEAGLLHPHIPVVATGIHYRDLPKAQALATCPWPELIAQGPEESGPKDALRCKRIRQVANARGYRVSTTTTDYFVEDLAPVADIVIWQAQSASIHNIARCRDLGAERWTFHSELTNQQNAPLGRYAWGVWAYKLQARCNLIWAFADVQGDVVYSQCAETPDGPVTTPALEGLREGTVDYRALQALAATVGEEAVEWIGHALARVRLAFWPDGYYPPGYQVPEDYREQQIMRGAQTPHIDMDRMRALALQWWEWEALRRLREGAAL